MGKIVILVMGANAEIAPGIKFIDEFNIARNTWAKDYADIIYYDGGLKYMNNEYDEENHILHLACEDDMEFVFKKTWMALKWLVDNNKIDKRDWVFRTNTSTAVNIPVLKYIVEKFAIPTDIYCSDIYSLSEANCPYPLCLYGRGNGLLISYDRIVENILKDGISFLYTTITDDIGIGNLFNSYSIKNNDKVPYYEHIKGLPHGWWKSVDRKFNNNHKVCPEFGNDKFIPWCATWTFKRYRNRETELDNYNEIAARIPQSDSDVDLSIYDNKIKEAINNPDVFIGSILGYIDFEKWKIIDKNDLYLLEITHKAVDDEQYQKYIDIQGKNF